MHLFQLTRLPIFVRFTALCLITFSLLQPAHQLFPLSHLSFYHNLGLLNDPHSFPRVSSIPYTPRAITKIPPGREY